MSGPSPDAFRFVFMTDCQLGCYATFSGLTAADVQAYAARGMRVGAVPAVSGWDWDARRLADAVAAAQQLSPAFVVVGGDMVDDAASAGQYADVRRLTAPLEPRLHWVPGNHDCAPDAITPTPQSLAAYRRRFGPDHYAFSVSGAACIVVNTVVLANPGAVADELDAQLGFVEEAVRAAREDGAATILVFGHHPLFTAAADEPDTYWNIPLVRRRPLLELFKAFGVRAYFCGHWHRNGGGWDETVEVAVTGPVGYPLGADPPGFRVVDVDGDRVSHRYLVTPQSVAPSSRGGAWTHP